VVVTKPSNGALSKLSTAPAAPNFRVLCSVRKARLQKKAQMAANDVEGGKGVSILCDYLTDAERRTSYDR
jgi:hypothetical protein